MKRTVLLTLACVVSAALPGCQPATQQSTSADRILPSDPTFDAVYERLGNPDRITGSGRSFLHYDLKTGQTLTLIVSGDKLTGSEVTDQE